MKFTDQELKSTRLESAPQDRAWSLTPTKVKGEYTPDRDQLDLRRVHPEGVTRQEIMSESPKRWDLLHQFVKASQLGQNEAAD